ncbi:MAG: restriction endonuclease subunit S [Bacteroidetes bacterium]|nr:restriction endonuclease subunit S [Bacteroidota bacterium]
MSTPPYQLPESWCWVALGTIFQYDAGVKCDSHLLNPSAWLLYLKDIEKETGHLLKRVSLRERNPKSTKSFFLSGDILYGKTNPHLNKVLVADEDGYSTTEIISIRPYKYISPQFCAIALRSSDFVQYASAHAGGVKMPRLRTKNALSAPFPLPPLAEQHRIVKKVNELMTLCDQLELTRRTREDLRENLNKSTLNRLLNSIGDESAFQSTARYTVEAIPILTKRVDQVKYLRQVIHNLAVSGKLALQDSTDEPALELLKRIADLKERLLKRGEIRQQKINNFIETPPFVIPSNWSWAQIREVTSDRGQTVPSTPFTYIDVSSIDKEKGILTRPKVLHPNKAPSRARKIAQSGDVIFSCVRPYLLNIAIIEDVLNPPVIVSTAFEVLNGHGLVLPNYIWIVLRTTFFIELVKIYQRGQAYPAIKSTDFATLPIPIPPLAEQRRIVAKVNELMSLCDQLEASISRLEISRSRLVESIIHEVIESSTNESIHAGHDL